MPDQPLSPTENEIPQPNLPIVLPSITALVRRSQTTLGLLRDVVQESSSEYWYERGYESSVAENWAQAEFEFTSAIQLANEDHSAYFMRGCVKERMQDFKGALEDLARSIELKSTFEAYKQRAYLRYKLKDYSGAAFDFDILVGKKSRSASFSLHRAICMEQIKNWVGARKDYDCAIELAPQWSQAYNQRAAFKEASGDWAGGEADRKLGYLYSNNPISDVLNFPFE